METDDTIKKLDDLLTDTAAKKMLKSDLVEFAVEMDAKVRLLKRRRQSQRNSIDDLLERNRELNSEVLKLNMVIVELSKLMFFDQPVADTAVF